MNDIDSVAVIIQQREGFEEEFDRCQKSVERAINRADWKTYYKIFTSKNASKEDIILQNLGELKKFNLITFVDASDYVNKRFFETLPREYDKNTILAAECFTTQCNGAYLYLERLNGFAGTYISSEYGPIIPIFEDGNCPLDCHVWGYFYPSNLILKDSFIKIISENKDRMGSCVYWSFFTKNKNLRVRILPNSRYYHMAIRVMETEKQILTCGGFEHYLETYPFMKLAHEINSKFPLHDLGFPGRAYDTNLYSTSIAYGDVHMFNSIFIIITDFNEIREAGGFTKQESQLIKSEILDQIKGSKLEGKIDNEEFWKLLNGEA